MSIYKSKNFILWNRYLIQFILQPIYDFSSLDTSDQTILKARQILRMKKLPKYVSL